MENGRIKEKIEDLITRLARAIQVNRVYGKDHNLTREAVNSLSKMLDQILTLKETITLGIIGDEFAFEKEPLYELSLRRKNFINFLKTIGVKKISFRRGGSQKELMEFIQILAAKSEPSENIQDLQQILNASDIQHIQLGEIGFQDRKKPPPLQEEQLRHLVKRDYQNSIQMLTQTFQELKGNQSLNVQSARQIVEGMIKNMLQNKNLLLVLTSLKAHDENTFLHGVNVAIFTLLQAEVLGLEDKYLMDMGMAALLHDIGKLSLSADEQDTMSSWLPEEKTSREKERKQVDQDVAGAKILLETEGIGTLAAIAAFEHNISYDLSGLPRKLYGKKLNLVSMMIAISDFYDKIRRKPSFYEEGGPEKAYDEMMKLSGTQFHPDLLKNFFSVIGVYPPGTLVELDTKEIALVIQASMLDIKRPQVEILYASTGERYKEPKIVNLVEKDKRGQYKKSVIKSISPLDKFELPEKYK